MNIKMNQKNPLFLFILISMILPLYGSEPFNNIMGFYGERAAGLSGAYTAISDDPSGAYYNPAGLAFGYNDGFSISASNYKISERNYKGIDTPGQVYQQKSQGYEPNFIGITKRFQSMRFAFSLVNTYNLSYDRADQVNYPLVSPTIDQTRNYTKEKYSQILVGPSFAFPLGNQLSWGVTLYYMNDVKNLSRSQFQRFKDSTMVSRSFIDNRMTTGLLPILGIQYQPHKKISLGASLRRIITLGGNRLYNEIYSDTARTVGANSVDYLEGTENAFTTIESGKITRKPNLNASIPQLTELRLGVAFFPTSRFLASFDTIYTGGYKAFRDQTEFSVFGTRYTTTFTDREIRELTRVSTLNFALGMEYYIAETFSILAGVYTNEPNTKPISWTESAIDVALQNSFGNSLSSTQDNNTYTYSLARSGTNPRNEYSRNRGFSLGLSWVNAKSSVSLIYIKESGFGNSRIDPNTFSQPFEYNSNVVYVMVSSRN